jgi:prolyl-tRNA synthetase
MNVHPITKEYFLKNVVYKDVDGLIIIVVIRGDLSINQTKLAKLVGAKGELEPATDKDLESIGTKSGWVHCWGHKAIYAGDLSLKTVHNFIGGQKQKDTDSINVNYGRDFECQFFGDIAEAQEGDICPKCKKSKLSFTKAIEFGHIFNIGYVYSDPMDIGFVDKDGSIKKLYMGSYGIGVGRALATIVETHYDNKGIIWPESIAPYQIHLIGLDLFDEEIKKQAENLYQKLLDKNIEVLFDDREGLSAGEKFADADLLGIPTRVVVSARSMKESGVEVKKRIEEKGNIFSVEELLNLLKSNNS